MDENIKKFIPMESYISECTELDQLIKYINTKLLPTIDILEKECQSLRFDNSQFDERLLELEHTDKVQAKEVKIKKKEKDIVEQKLILSAKEVQLEMIKIIRKIKKQASFVIIPHTEGKKQIK